VSENTLEEFLTIVTRDLGAESAHVLNAGDVGDEPEDGDGSRLGCDLPGGRRLVAFFAAPPADVDALRRRLAMLASAFADILPRGGRTRGSRPPPSHSLRDELAALAKRAGAVDAVVIDAHSPVLWARASERSEAQDVPEGEAPLSAPGALTQTTETPSSTPPLAANEESPESDDLALVTRLRQPSIPVPRVSGEHLSLVAGEALDATAATDEQAPDLTQHAIDEVRALPELAELKRGGHVRHMASEDDFGCVAHSFAAIYLLILVFDGPFDELLAKRAVAQALPTIERLVAALPPIDPPPPMAGAAALRPRRRRR
jgi:hypothetical protein